MKGDNSYTHSFYQLHYLQHFACSRSLRQEMAALAALRTEHSIILLLLFVNNHLHYRSYRPLRKNFHQIIIIITSRLLLLPPPHRHRTTTSPRRIQKYKPTPFKSTLVAHQPSSSPTTTTTMNHHRRRRNYDVIMNARDYIPTVNRKIQIQIQIQAVHHHYYSAIWD